jgi:acylpyruvate hydrolase
MPFVPLCFFVVQNQKNITHKKLYLSNKNMKIICIGRNYVDHILELNNVVDRGRPVVFMKPDTALLTDGKPFYYPEWTKDLHYELEIVLRICKNGRHIQPEFAHTYFDQLTVGIDFTARDLQEQLKAKGQPWELAKSFDHAAVIGQMRPTSQYDLAHLEFELTQNDKIVQQGDSRLMLFDFVTIICFVSQYFTLKTGDLIFTGTPAGVGAVQIGDQLHGTLQGETLLTCAVL